MMRSTARCLIIAPWINPHSTKNLAIRNALGSQNNVCEQPYYLKPVAMNPYLGTQHDGTSSEYHRGFSVKPIHHLYRFTHNLLPENIPRNGLRSPEEKRLHWMESTTMTKFANKWWSYEALPPFFLACGVVTIITLHLIRFAFWSPDITWYNLSFPTNKNFVQFVRFNEKHPMDQPIYRYLSQASEFWVIDHHKRGLIENDLIANDPYIKHVKAIGRGEELLATSSPNPSPGAVRATPGGRGGYGHLVPAVFKEKSEWWTPTDEALHHDHQGTWDERIGGRITFWSLYSQLNRY